LRELLRKTDWVLEEASFTYLDGLYRGPGLLTWDPEKGFHLEAFVARSGKPLPTHFKLGEVRLATRKDRTSVRMRIKRGGRALAFVVLTDRWDLVMQDRLSCALGAVRFMTRLPEAARNAKRWFGSAQFQVGKSVLWPDTLTRTVQLDGQPWSESFERSGLKYETTAISVHGLEEERRLQVQWSMHKGSHRRADAWRWASAFGNALAIELGRSVRLLERQVLAIRTEHSEWMPTGKVVSLFPFQPFEGDLVEKSRLFALTDLFMSDTREALICRKLFDQMVRAKEQARWDDTELILSTALEGALRSLDGAPSSDRSWKIAGSLAGFRKKYLSRRWKAACKQVLAAFKHLRHSTAHPDWSLDKMALPAEVERSRSFKDLLLLSRFYGYMILALAGVPDLQPVFNGRSLASPSVSDSPAAAAPPLCGPGEVM
jgi:hypothetical protein